jgi:hypothetical protein
MLIPCPVVTAGAYCYQTTGRASFCGISAGILCAARASDGDCVAAFGEGAACIVCASDCAQTNHTACIPAEI